MAGEKYADGWKGSLSIWDATASAYKPLACITRTAHSMTGNTKEKVNYCTEGKTITKLKNISEVVDFDAEVIDTTAIGGQSAKASLADIKAIMRKQAKDDVSDFFKLERDFDGPMYFEGQFLSISDEYSAEDDATFSGQIAMQTEPSETDPKAGG